MHVWDYRNRRHKGLRRKPPRPKANATAHLTREDLDYELELQDEEKRRQTLEDAEVEIKQEDIRRLILDYMGDSGGKQELDEVAENLRHWKEHCSALGYDSDGEAMSVVTPTLEEGLDEGEVAARELRARERKRAERGERSRRRNAREVFDMFDADGSRTISTTEMKALLAEMCIPVDKQQLKDLMAEIDTDNSGEVDFNEFYRWYIENASAARNADKTQAVGLFATRFVKGLTGFTLRMEALRVIIAHAQSQVGKRQREEFRLYRPPRLCCDHCGEAFASAKEQKRHVRNQGRLHEAWKGAELEAKRRFHPVTTSLHHTSSSLEAGIPAAPFNAADGPTARKKRLRRLVFSDKFYSLYGGIGWGGAGGMGSPEIEVVGQERWINKPHPRLADPTDRRSAQLRRGQSVEGINPADQKAKVPLEHTVGGLSPGWGGVRRGRTERCVAGRDSKGLQHILLRLTQEKARAANVFMADCASSKALVQFRWEGWSLNQVTLHTEFNNYKGQGMGEDQTSGRIGHETWHSLCPGTYKYYFVVDGQRRVGESLPFVSDDGGDLCNIVTVTNQHLKEEGERAIASVHDYIAGNPLSFHLGHTQSVLAMSSRLSSPVKRSESVVGQRYPETAAENAAMHTTQSRTAASAMARPREDESSDQLRVHHDPKDHEPSAPAPAVTTGRRAVDVPDAIADALRATRGSLTGIPVTSVVGAGRSDTEAVDEVEGTASSTKWLKRIDLSRHQICDDGAVALALAMRHNVRVKEVDLSLNRMSGAGVAALAASLADPTSGVTSLCLAQNGIGRRGGEHLAKMLSGGARDGDVEWGHVPCLRELNVADNMLGDDGVEDLSTGLLGHPCLETLILDGNDIGHDGVERLSEALLRNASVRTLSLRRNGLLADAAERLSAMLCRNGVIESLDISYNPMGPEGVRRLSHFLYKNTRLGTLRLRGCEVQASGVKSGVFSLTRGLCVNRAVTFLDLAANHLDEYAGQELAHALLKNKALTDIVVTGNHIPEEWLRENHQVCNEVYNMLPSLAESLRLNRVGKKEGRRGFVSPRSSQRRAKRANELRTAKRLRRLEHKRKREAQTLHQGQPSTTQAVARGEFMDKEWDRNVRADEAFDERDTPEKESEKTVGQGSAAGAEGLGDHTIRNNMAISKVATLFFEGVMRKKASPTTANSTAEAYLTRRVPTEIIEKCTGQAEAVNVPAQEAKEVPGHPRQGDPNKALIANSTREPANIDMPRDITASSHPCGSNPSRIAGYARHSEERTNSDPTTTPKKREKRKGDDVQGASLWRKRRTDSGKVGSHGIVSSSHSVFAAPGVRQRDPREVEEEGQTGSNKRNEADLRTKEPLVCCPPLSCVTQKADAIAPHGPSTPCARNSILPNGVTIVPEAISPARQDHANKMELAICVEDGARREHGEWTRKGIWAPMHEISSNAADRARVEGRRLGDRQRQRREDEEVAHAGKMKREELLEYLKTPEGESLAIKVAKLLDHAQRTEERERRTDERRQKAAFRASHRLQRRRQAHTQKNPMFRTRPWAFTKSLLGTLGTTMTGAHFVRPNSEGALTAAVGPSQGALWPKDGVRSMPKEEVHRPGATGADTAKAIAEWEDAMSEGGGSKQLTLATLRTNSSTAASSLPSAVAVGAMQAEDEEDTKQALGKLREEKKIGDLLAQLLLPEAFSTETSDAVTTQLVKEAHDKWRAEKKAAAKAARRAGLHEAPEPMRPFTIGSGEEMISRDWACRVILAVGEREARLEAADVFRGNDVPRFVCPKCHEFCCSSPDGLDEHLREKAWHEIHAAMQEVFEENADLVAVAKRVSDGARFPDYFQVARDLPGETELLVHEEASEISRPLGTVKFNMIVLALEEAGQWLKINFELHRGVYVKHTMSSGTSGRERSRTVLTRMQLPATRASAKAIASTAHLSGTSAATLLRPITLATSGLAALGRTTVSTLNTVAFVATHGHRSIPEEPQELAPGTAIFKPRIVRFVLPRIYCHARGVPPGALLKIRTDPGSGAGGSGGVESSDIGGGNDGSKVLGRLGANECVIASATSGDWLQIRYKNYEAAWMLVTYRGRQLLSPLADMYPGADVAVAPLDKATQNERGGVRDSPFPMPLDLFEKKASAYADEAHGATTARKF